MQVKNESKLLNADDHSRLIQKYQKDPQKCRPDILHQCLLMLQDSPLNQTGHLQVFYIFICLNRYDDRCLKYGNRESGLLNQ